MLDSAGIMAAEISSRLDGGLDSFWLYGSAVTGDFRLGWSDIDFIAFAKRDISEKAAERLIMLRQEMTGKHPGNPFFRLFEGVIVSAEELRKGAFVRLVYWGTSGQRITNGFELDPFARYELAKFGSCVYGSAESGLFAPPDARELAAAVQRHYEGIRRYAVQTDERLYSCGWLLDISRCIYTLRTGEVISKTAAGEWALENGIFEDDAPLAKALEIRRAPLEYRDRADVREWLSSLGKAVQRYADKLEAELERFSETR